MNILQLHKQKK